MGSRLPKDDLRVTPPPRLKRRSDVGGKEVTDVDVEKLQETLDKVVSTINRSARNTEQIPGIRKKVDATSDKVIQLDTKMDVVTDRVERVEKKADRPHDCYNIEVIAELKDSQREISQKVDTDVQKGIKQAEKLAALTKETAETETDVEDLKKAPRRLFYGLLGIIVTIAIGAGGAIWFLAELNKDVEFEQQQRVDQFKRIETQMQTIGSKSDTAPVQRALKTLAEEVEESNGHAEAFDRLCDDMQVYEKRQLKSILLRRNKRVPQSCM